ncbi:hypothetical protein [Burkholderia pseudomallei]|uniref:hypothetical protein n=1 Tax=Burkholderia pseudomallei TaxID=28450 RepID=UPI001AAF9A6C|nr:hypothetical protein [Burkholderia pseudomallei]MBO2984110.1 hypothetical protein [Burkholderia pseudomallei]MBO7916210.1 hypothetical protein [Burkholderia pseudomallei]
MSGDEEMKGKTEGGSAFAEGMTAIQTAEVVEYVGIDGVTEGGAGCAAGRATEEAAEDGAGNASERSTDGAGDHADCSASFRTGDRHNDAAGSTCEGTGRAGDLGCAIDSLDKRGLTAWAGNRHQHS